MGEPEVIIQVIADDQWSMGKHGKTNGLGIHILGNAPST